VYKARDTRLNRTVAVKVSAQQFSYEISVGKTSDTSPIPPEKSATRHLALTISLVRVGEWNGVFQARSGAHDTQ
jgi:hypothetical protein